MVLPLIAAAAEGLGAGLAASGGAVGTAAASAGGGLAAAQGTAATTAFGRQAAFSAGKALGTVGNANLMVNNSLTGNVTSRPKLGSNDSTAPPASDSKPAGDKVPQTAASSYTDKTVRYE